jgi:uncharacterized DUF497 family protein
VEISFDPDKRERNLAKHGLDLAEAGALLSGPCVERLDDRFDYGEERWISVGMLRGEVVLCVWTEASDDEPSMRPPVHPPDEPKKGASFSLRRATANEQEDYFRQIGG